METLERKQWPYMRCKLATVAALCSQGTGISAGPVRQETGPTEDSQGTVQMARIPSMGQRPVTKHWKPASPEL